MPDEEANLSVLVVVAHPDDESLGCGATLAAATKEGVTARACILSGGADARRHRPSGDALVAQTRGASRILGLEDPVLGSFPNIAMNTVPHLELVQFIEAAIVSTSANVIFTHHPADLNDDHRRVSEACRAAARLWQRRAGIPALRAFYHMEILSSTDWAFPADGLPFRPNTFVPVNRWAMKQKLSALDAYEGVMRQPPHSRSAKVVQALAVLRGAQAHVPWAEAFECVFSSREPAGLLG